MIRRLCHFGTVTMPTIRELEAVCQKPDWREVGSLLARRFARPLALYLTWIAVRWRVSPNAITALALVVGFAAAWLMGMPSAYAFVAGAIVLQLWYLLDHVDGQVARYHRGESVTGVYFDFMMHHLIHTASAFALGYSVAARSGELAWTLAGAAFSLGLMTLSMSNDCRYKAFFSTTRRLEMCPTLPMNRGERGGTQRTGHWERSNSDGSCVRRPLFPLRSTAASAVHFVHRLCLKVCEMPNIVLWITGLALWVAIHPATGFRAVQGYLLFMSVLAPALGIARLAKQVWLRLPDAEFGHLVSRGATNQLVSYVAEQETRPTP